MNRSTTMPASTEGPRVSSTAPSTALRPTDVPDSIADMMTLATILATADTYVPAAIQGNAGNALALMLRARALDVELAVAWDELYLAGPDVGMSARLVRALARRAGHRIAYVEHDAYHAVALIQCTGEQEPHEVRFTLQDAMNMGLTDPGRNRFAGEWERQPENMLVARVTTRAVNRHCPEVMLGLSGLLMGSGDDGLEVESDAVSALKEEHCAMVAQVLREAEGAEEIEDGAKRLATLRDIFVTGRDGGVLDYAADDTGEYRVRRVLTEKMTAADRLARQQVTPEKPEKPEKRPARKRATKKAALTADAKGSEQTPDGTAGDGGGAGERGKAPVRQRTTRKAAPARAGARPGGRSVSAEGEARAAPCGCDVDSILSTGVHADTCKGSR